MIPMHTPNISHRRWWQLSKLVVNTNGNVNSTVKAPMAFPMTFPMNRSCPRLMKRSLTVETTENSLACREWQLLEVFLALGHSLEKWEGGEGPQMSG